MLIWEGYDSPEASAAFRKKYDVSVQPQLLTSDAEVITKLLAGGASDLSLVTPGNGLVPLLVQADAIDPVDWKRIPNTAKLGPRFVELGQTQLSVDGQTYAVPYTWGLNTLIYNEKYVSSAPQSFMDLTKPEYTNKIGFWDNVATIQTWATVLGYDALNMTQAELDKVTDFIIDLKQNQGRLFTGDFVQMAKALASGDVIAFGSAIWTYVATTLAPEQGSKTVKWTVPSEGSIFWTDTWALPKGGPNQDTAYAWINFMIGQEANALVAEQLSTAPVNESAIRQVTEDDSSSASSTTDLYASEVEEKSELFGFPVGGNGTVSYQDWTDAWKRVQAA